MTDDELIDALEKMRRAEKAWGYACKRHADAIRALHIWRKRDGERGNTHHGKHAARQRAHYGEKADAWENAKNRAFGIWKDMDRRIADAHKTEEDDHA